MFLLSINDIDIDLNISVEIVKFADYTKVICSIEYKENSANVHVDLDRLLGWSNKWQMHFKIEKYKVMQFGYNNQCLEYIMGGSKLTMTVSEKEDLGVMPHSTLKLVSHIDNCVKTANQMLGMIQRTVTYKTKKII